MGEPGRDVREAVVATLSDGPPRPRSRDVRSHRGQPVPGHVFATVYSVGMTVSYSVPSGVV